MAETIKGINVVIGSETTALTAALSDVNKASRDIQSELKQVERLLRLDPTNTELVAQQQQLLGNAVENSQEKLNRLRAAQEQVNQQFARGEISEGQYRAFQREVAAAEQQLQSFEQRLRDTQETTQTLGQRLQETGEQAGKIGEKMKGAGEKMSLVLTAPIAAAGAVMLKGAIDAETATGKLQAQLGITADEAADLGAVAQDVWLNGFGENIDEATESIKTVRQNMGILAEDELSKVTQGAMTIADVFGAEVTDSTKAAGTMMKNFGISGQDALDLITVGFQKGGDYSGELLDTLNEYAPQFSSMGLTAEQAMGILVAGAEAGSFSLDKVGDAVKEFNIRAQDGSKTTADGFAAIGLNADQMGAAIAQGGEKGQQAFTATIAALAAMKDPVQQNTAGTALFGTQWEDVRSKVITAMADGMKGIGDFQGATDAAANAMYGNNPGLSLTVAMRELQAAIGPALLPLSSIITDTIVPAIKSMVDWFTSLSPAGQTVVLAIAGIVAAIGPLLMVLGPIVSVIGSVVGAIGAMSAAMAGGATGMAILTTAFPALGTVIAAITGPIGIAVAAITGLVVIGVMLYKNWDEIKAKATEIWDGIKNYFSETWKNITSACSEAWGRFKVDVTEIWNSVKDFFKKWGDEFLLLAVGPAGWVVLLTQKLGENWNNIKQTVTTAWENIKTGISNVWTSIKSGVSQSVGDVATNIKTGLENAWSYIKSIPSQALQWGKNIIQGLVNGIKSLKIPMPHFNFSVDYKSVAGVKFPVPDVDVRWYKTGGIFNSPQIVGVGDVPEAVTPLSALPDLMAKALAGAIHQLDIPGQGLAGTGAGQPIQLNVNLDGRVISQQFYYYEQGKLRGQGSK